MLKVVSKAIWQAMALFIRAIAFYIAFGLIAIGALLIGHVLIPILTTLNPQRSISDNRKLISSGARIYLNLLKNLGLLNIKCHGLKESFKGRPLVFAANHPSLLDVVFFISYFPECVVIIKSKLMKCSPYAKADKAAGYIVNTGSNEIVDPLCSELKAGNPVVIFPEGTRTSFPKTQSSGELQNWLENMKFHRGAAAVSLRSSFPIVPVLIDYKPKVLGRGQRWYQIPTKLCRASISFFEPVPTSCSSSNGINSEGHQDTPSSRRELTEKLEDFFKDHIITAQNLSLTEDKNFQPSKIHASFRP